MSKYIHLLLTKFNVSIGTGLQNDTNYLEYRFKLFDQFCYPSVQSQSNQNFKWLVFFDPNTPKEYKDKINKYSEWNNFIPCFISRFTEYEYKRPIIENIDKNSKYLITTRLDNDDAIAIDFIKNIQNQFACQDFEFINFSNGYIIDLHGNKLYFGRLYSNPFLSLIEQREKFKTIWSAKHSEVNKFGKLTNINSKPLWLQVVHEKNLLNNIRCHFYRVPIKSLNENIILNYYNIANEKYLPLCFGNYLRLFIYYFRILYKKYNK